MNYRAISAAFLAVLLSFFASEFALGCDPAQVNLNLSSSKIHISNALRCIKVDDDQDIDAEMTINLPSAGNYPLMDGQIVVVQTNLQSEEDFPPKSEMECDPGIEFDGTNVGNDDMTVRITGQRMTTGIGCYDVIVQGLGRLDPRAKIVQQNPDLLQEQQIARILDAVDDLQDTDYGPMFDVLTPEVFLQNAYGLSAEEARDIVYRHSQVQPESKP